ncbi:MAG TPA: UbiA family prenyltransferase, partial [Azonexus sp.]|nr:UbiA family prenyltransferase [Azonexus sp.]
MHTAATVSPLSLGQRLAAFGHLCKPRVNSLIVFTAMIGMCLATPDFPPLLRFIVAALGIALVSFAAAAMNCLVERTVDAKMARTSWRATARGDISPLE